MKRHRDLLLIIGFLILCALCLFGQHRQYVETADRCDVPPILLQSQWICPTDFGGGR